MINLLKRKKISETPFRKEVLAIFSKYNNAIPLSIVEKELKEYNRITLYRTIKVFLEKGIIHEITISGQESNYAICQFFEFPHVQFSLFRYSLLITITNIQRAIMKL